MVGCGLGSQYSASADDGFQRCRGNVCSSERASWAASIETGIGSGVDDCVRKSRSSRKKS